MAATFCKLAAIFLLAVSGIKASPTPDSKELLDRRAAPVVVNGNFNAPLGSSWVCNGPGGAKCPSAIGFRRVKSGGNYVGQIDGAESCQGTHTAYLHATINNLQGGQTYILSFRYKFSEAVTYPYWGYTEVSHAYTLGPEYTKKAKANVWYDFNVEVGVIDGHSGSQVLTVAYIYCPNDGGPSPTVQLDDFKIVPE